VSFRQSQWAITIVGGAIAAIIAGLVLAAVISGQTAGSSSPTSGPSSSKSATATATPTVSGGGSGSGGPPAIYHKGTLTLAYTTCADLDAPPTDPQWGETSGANGDTGGADLCSEFPSFVGTNGATIVTVNSGTDTTCQNATGWLTPNLYQDLHLSVGSFVCVHTNQGRYSLLRVESIDSTNSSITFSVKTFKKPGD
jgi:hypothetical protein